MAEAIGTISAILTVVETSVSTSLKLYHFFTTIRDAPREIMSISRDVRNFNTLVQNLRAALTSADVQRIVSQDSQIDQALKDLLDPIENCQQVCAQVQGKLERHFKAETASGESSGGNTTIQPLTRNHTGSIRWYFRRGEVLALIGRFQLTKGMFSDAMGGLTLLLTFKASSMMSGGVTNTHIPVNHASDDDANHSTTLRMGRKHKFDDDAGSAFLQYAQQLPTDDLSKTTTLVHALKKSSDPKYAKELLDGVRRGSAVSVELVLDHVDIDAREPHTGRTALSIAAELGNIKITELLLIQGATVNTRQYSRSNPYLRNSPHRHPIMTSGRSPLHWAISGSHSMIVELLLQYGANPNSRNSVGRSVLQDACMKNDLKSARLLLQNGADVNARSYNHGWTPLHEAANVGSVELLQVLLEYEPLLDVPAEYHPRRATPLHIAARYRHLDVLKLLLSSGADPDVLMLEDMTALHLAAAGGWIPGINALVDSGASINPRDACTWETPLHKAARNLEMRAINILCARGADTKTKNVDGQDYQTLMDYARRYPDDWRVDPLFGSFCTFY